MNDFKHKLLRYGLFGRIEKSTRKGKKWMYIPSEEEIKEGIKKVHFGAEGYDDWTIHHDIERRKRYKARAGLQRLKDGSLAIENKYSPAWFSYYFLW